MGLESSAKPLAPIFGLAALSLLVLFVFDAGAFRTAWYSKFIEPESFAGSFEGTLRNEQTRPMSAPHRVVVLGDSSIAEGFSAKLANQSEPGREWFFVNAATPGATIRTWFYLLRDLDPAGTRYNVVVLPLADYVDADGIYPAVMDDEADREIDLSRLIVRLRMNDASDFPFTYLPLQEKLWALRGTLFKGFVYRRDFREFLRAPIQRIEKVNFFREHRRDWTDSYSGNPGALSGLRYEAHTNKLAFPAAFSAETRNALRDQIQPGRLHVEGRRRAYRTEWLGRIIDHYKASKATIVFVRVPVRPVRLQVDIKTNGTPFVEEQVDQGNAIAVDADAFADLETPAMFFDAYHLNSQGRADFSPRLAQAVISAVNRSRGL